MANPWIEHVKQKAKELNVSYGCAISLPEVKKSYKPKAKPSKPTKPRKKTEQKRMAMEDIDVPPPKPVAKKAVVKKADVKKKSPAKGKPLSLKDEHGKFKKSVDKLLPDQEPFEIFGIANDEKLQDASDELIDDMGQTFDIQSTAENYADDEIIEPHEIIKMISDYLDPKGKYADQIDKDVKQGFGKLSPDDQLKLIIITVNNLIFSGELTDAKAIRSIYYPSLSKYLPKSLKTTAKKYNKKELYI